MERRAFLSGLAGMGAVPLVGQAVSAAAASDVKSASDIKVVPAGRDFEDVNRAMGYSRLTMKVGSAQTQDGLFLIEQNFTRKGGPPRHIHPHQDEWFYVIDGAMVIEVADRRLTLKPGDSVLAPRGIPHVFAYVGESPGKALIGFTPAGKMEAFFRKVAIAGAPAALTKDVFEAHDMIFVGPPLKV
jgi:quercetin dioxygenase-like cupin family protein